MKSRKLVRYSIPALLLAGFMFLAGCETTAGVGRDVEAAGDSLEDSAESNQPYESRD